MTDKMKKRIPAVVAGVLLLFWYGVIFSFSAQDGEASGGLSDAVCRFLAEGFNFLAGRNMSPVQIDALAESMGFPIRKLAHFSEYAFMGVLVERISRELPIKRSVVRLAIGVFWVAASAALDEWHQYFVPGRCASIPDVILDTCGGIFGILILRAIYRRFHTRYL